MNVQNTEYITITDEATEQEYDSRDWGYLYYECEIPDAVARRYTQTIAGMDGVLDLTEALGGVNFDNRQIVLRLVYDSGSSQTYHHEASRLRNLLDGRVVRVMFSEDREWFWRGRCQVATEKVHRAFFAVELTIDAGPYKLKAEGSYDAWVWDNFSFVDGVIIQELDVQLENETKTVTLPIDAARGKAVLWLVSAGTIGVSAKMEDELTWHVLKQGENRIPEIRMSNTEERVLMLKGTGTVGIDYRLGSL